jgi:hypothetical protein
MNEIPTIMTERVDDIPLLLAPRKTPVPGYGLVA